MVVPGRRRAPLSTAASLAAAALGACSSIVAPEPVPERSVRAADGARIAYEERGRGEPLLVFVHGWCGDRGVWRTTLAALEDEYRVLALDLAGHGTSSAERSSWTLADLAGDVVAVVEASGASSCILVGHSMGAPVSLLAAPRLAPRVLGIVAVEALHDADFAYPAEYLAQAADELDRDFRTTMEAAFRPLVPGDPDLGTWLLERALRTDRRAAAEILRAVESFELAPVLSAADVPVRAINADPGSGGRLATAIERNREIADFEAVMIQDVGHYPMCERPAEFQRLLRLDVAALRERTAP